MLANNRDDFKTEVFTRLGPVAVVLATLLGLFALAGWVTNTLQIARISSEFIPMAPSTAICMILLGVALFCRWRRPGNRVYRRIWITLAGIVMLIGAILLLQYVIVSLTDYEMDIERVMVPATLVEQGFVIGRMSPLTSLLFVLISAAALVPMPTRGARPAPYLVAQSLAAAVLVTALILMVGYMYGAPLLYGGDVTPVALTTVVAFILLSFGLLFEGKNALLFRWVASSSVAARFTRLVVPGAAAIIIISRWLHLESLTLNEPVSYSLTALLSAGLVTLLIVVAARKVQATVTSSEEALRVVSSRQEATLAAVPDIIMEVDNDKIYTWANQAGIEFFGEDVIGKEASDFFEGEQDTYCLVQPIFDGNENIVYVESWQRRNDGQKRLLAWWCRVLKDEKGNVTGALSSARDITKNREAEEASRRTAQEWQTTFDATNDAIWIVDQEQHVLRSNKTAERFFHSPAEELIGRCCWEVVHGTTQPIPECPLNRARKSLHRESLELQIDETWYEVTVDPIIDEAGQFAGAVHIVEDISERIRAQEEKEKLQNQLLQAGKMEAVGCLAGGVAHDFNNMLGAIIGNAEMALMETQAVEPIYSNLQEILKAAQRSADLTRQLLAFARKQSINPKVLDLNDTAAGMLKMLERLLGEDIELVWKPAPDLAPVKLDPTQVDQLLVNLAVNARDAIDGVGIMTIETENVVIDDSYCHNHAGFIPGDFVQLAVSDNGCGMSKEVLDQLFQPFFTTKETGKGTGLGLAMVYGIVKQNNGFINVYSEPGQGTTFRIYLPRARSEAVMQPKAAEKKSAGGTETVLIVEDETAILDIGKQVLEQAGYTVLAADTPEQAIRLATEHTGTIHLLITDVIMPEMNGKDLNDKLTVLRPGIRALFMSGYAADVIAHQGILDDGVQFLQKPFSINALTAKVREALNS